MTQAKHFESRIPWYVADKVDPGERRQIAAHLDECSDCRAAEREARILADLGRVELRVLEEHVHPAHLESFAFDPGSLGPELADWIRRHVESCTPCAEAAGILQDERGARARHAAPPRRGGLFAFLRGTLLHPVAAGAYLLLLLVLAPYLATRSPSPGDPSSGRSVELVVLSNPMREATDLPVVRAGTKHTTVAIGADVRLPGDAPADGVVRFELIDGAGGVTRIDELSLDTVDRRMRQTGAVVLLVPSSKLPSGTYRLRVAIVGDADGTLVDTPFEVIAD